MKRNRIIYAVLLLAGFYQEIYAQSTLIPGFPKSEIFVSGNRTLINGIADYVTLENRFGYGMGINVIFRESRNIKLILGVEFVRTSQFRKSEYVSLGSGWDGDVIWNFSSLSFPVKARYVAGEKFQFYAEAGICGDVTMHAVRESTERWVELVNGKPVFQHTYRAKNEINLRKYNIGFVSGAGISVPVFGIRVLTALNYTHIFGEIEDRTPDICNRYLSISIGIVF